MKITIKTLTKGVFNFDTNESDTVSDLKTKISQDQETENELIRLVYAGKVLDDDSLKISDLGYKEQDFMVMLIKKKKKPVPAKVEEETAVNDKDEKIYENEESSESKTVDNQSPVNQSHGSPPEDLTSNIQSNMPSNEPINIWSPTSQVQADSDHPQLSPDQVQQLNNILEHDPTISQILESSPNLREHLQNPEVLIELLRRMGHPLANSMPDLHRINNPEEAAEEEGGDGPQVVHVTQEEANILTELRDRIKEVFGENLPFNDGQLNALIYQAYTMMDKNKEATLAFLIDQFM